jgi:hypothetical protein
VAVAVGTSNDRTLKLASVTSEALEARAPAIGLADAVEWAATILRTEIELKALLVVRP